MCFFMCNSVGFEFQSVLCLFFSICPEKFTSAIFTPPWEMRTYYPLWAETCCLSVCLWHNSYISLSDISLSCLSFLFHSYFTFSPRTLSQCRSSPPWFPFSGLTPVENNSTAACRRPWCLSHMNLTGSEFCTDPSASARSGLHMYQEQ